MFSLKKRFLLPLSICIPISPIIAISCSQSLESRLESLLNNPNIIDLEINFQEIKNVTKKEKVDLKDLFITNIKTIKIIQLEPLTSWNNGLSNEDRNSFLIEPKIVGIIFPDFETENQVNQLKIIIDVSAGHLQNKTIEKTLDLSNLSEFNNLITKKENNYFDWTSLNNLDNSGPVNNDLYRTLRNNVLKVIKEKGLINNENWNNISSLNTQLDFTFSLDEKKNIYQRNLHCSFDEMKNNTLFVNIYTNSTKLSGDNLDNLRNTQISMKISYSYSDLFN